MLGEEVERGKEISAFNFCAQLYTQFTEQYTFSVLFKCIIEKINHDRSRPIQTFLNSKIQLEKSIN